MPYNTFDRYAPYALERYADVVDLNDAIDEALKIDWTVVKNRSAALAKINSAFKRLPAAEQTRFPERRRFVAETGEVDQLLLNVRSLQALRDRNNETKARSGVNSGGDESASRSTAIYAALQNLMRLSVHIRDPANHLTREKFEEGNDLVWA